MKQPQLLSLAFTTVSVCVLTIAAPVAHPKGERVAVSGEVVEMWCYLEAGDRGASKKACATACAKAAIRSPWLTTRVSCICWRA